MSQEIFLPIVEKAGPVESRRIAIDPVTRIEGHLRIEVQVLNGRVTDAWSTGTMFRGLELILKGRDPREAWLLAQRICGVCTTVHAICSVRAVEDALGITVPDNARLVRNLIEGAQFIQDHVIHFYHLHAPDWIDVLNALEADPADASDLARSISDWPQSSPEYFAGVRQRLQTFVDSGQLGIFGNAYWGHPSYKLPPAGNLVGVAHYLEALDWQREYIKVHALLGGKNPHPQSYLVGGMSLPVSPTHADAVNPARIVHLRNLTAQALEFVRQVYLPDLLLVGSFYPEWAELGASPGHYMSYGDFPADTSGALSSLWLPRGIVLNDDIYSAPQGLNPDQIREYIAHSWYRYSKGESAGLHPREGETLANYTGPKPPYDWLDTNKYSWLKAPRYNELPMEVGPLARMAVAYAAGHTRVRQEIDGALAQLGLGPQALFSTLGRVLARGIETLLIAEQKQTWIDELEANMLGGQLEIHNGARWDPSTWPAEAAGWGSTEAPRGGLSHWVRIKNGKLDHYQAVVPTTWNGSPRDAAGRRGPWEEALIGTPVADPEQPLEVLRTVHSFDPCMACAVHLVDGRTGERTRVEDV
jgi:Ni,Fe-hydrogenase I large subunit